MPEAACLEMLRLKISGSFFQDGLVSLLLHVLGFDLCSSVVMVGEYIRRIFYYALGREMSEGLRLKQRNPKRRRFRREVRARLITVRAAAG